MAAGRKSGRSPELARAIRSARLDAGFTQEAAAELIGVNPMMISQYERGVHAPGIEIIRQMARVYGVSADRLLAVEYPAVGGATVVREVPTHGYVSAGRPPAADVSGLGSTPISADIAVLYPGAFALIISGNALEAEGMTDGDRILVHPDSPFESGRLFVVGLPGGALLAKRMSFEGGRVRLRATADDDYQELTPNGIQVLGRVVWHLRQM